METLIGNLFTCRWYIACEHIRIWMLFFNPLSDDVEYTPHDTVVASDSCKSGHSKNYEIFFWHKSVKFPTKWCTKLCNSVDIYFQYFDQKNALAVKGLRESAMRKYIKYFIELKRLLGESCYSFPKSVVVFEIQSQNLYNFVAILQMISTNLDLWLCMPY